MTHLPFIIASYGLFIALALYLSAGAALRLRTARLKLLSLEPAKPSSPGKKSVS